MRPLARIAVIIVALLLLVLVDWYLALMQSDQSIDPSAQPISFVRLAVLDFYLLGICLLCLATCLSLVPKGDRLTDDDGMASLLGAKVPLHQGQRLFLVVFTMGLLGGSANSLRWLIHHSATGDLYAKQFTWYLSYPWLGGATAVIFYFLLRGGLVSGPGAGQEINFYGLAGFAGAVGYYARDIGGKIGGFIGVGSQ